MQAYVIRRIVALIPTMLIVAIVSFSLVHLTPGDPAAVLLGDFATVEDLEAMRERLGLNEPVHLQFLGWIGDVARGDLGTSIYTDRPVIWMILDRLEPTMLLTLLSLIIAVSIGVPAGVVMAVRRNSPVDQGLLVFTLLGVAMPNFWLGINLILLLSVTLGLLPVAGYVPLEQSPVDTLKHLVMPAMALGFSQAALIARITRTSMLEVLNQDYVRTARAKGLSGRRVTTDHALRNAWIPIITIIGTSVAVLLSGSIVIETVFSLPGVGQLVITAVERRDYPVIQGTILFITTIYVLLSLLIDLMYLRLDPRLRLN